MGKRGTTLYVTNNKQTVKVMHVNEILTIVSRMRTEIQAAIIARESPLLVAVEDKVFDSILKQVNTKLGSNRIAKVVADSIGIIVGDPSFPLFCIKAKSTVKDQLPH